MAAYNAAPFVPSIAAGDFFTVWSAESPVTGNGGASASQQVALSQGPGATGMMGISANGKFSGAPGAFEIDLQVSDVDTDANYQTVQGGVINSVDATNNTWRVDAPNVNALFARLLMRTQPANAVSSTARIKR